MKPSYRGDRKHIAVASFSSPPAELAFEVWRVKPGIWRERGASRNRPENVADLCIGALARLGLQPEPDVFKVGQVEVAADTLCEALSDLPQLSAPPPDFSAPGCAQDVADVGEGVFGAMRELFGRPTNVVCSLAYPLCNEYLPLEVAVKPTI